jgi:hypothetical protein
MFTCMRPSTETYTVTYRVSLCELQGGRSLLVSKLRIGTVVYQQMHNFCTAPVARKE